jgi:hypothetical protein
MVVGMGACDKNAPNSRFPTPAEIARHPGAAALVSENPDWRPPPVLEGGQRVSIGDAQLDALAVAGREGGPPSLMIVEARREGQAPSTWLRLPTSFDSCTRMDVELIEIEGLEGSGILMTQLLCDRASIPFERLSSTSLIRLDHAERKGELLWQGEGWFVNNQDLCKAYEVYSFRASVDGQRVEVLLDREVIADQRPGVAVECQPEEFRQESIEIVELGVPGDSSQSAPPPDES